MKKTVDEIIKEALGRELNIKKHSIVDLREIPIEILTDLRLIASKVNEKYIYSYMRHIVDIQQLIHVQDFIDDIIMTNKSPKLWGCHNLVFLEKSIKKLVTKSTSDIINLLSPYGEIKKLSVSPSAQQTSPNICGGFVVEIFDHDYRNDMPEGTSLSDVSDHYTVDTVDNVEIAFRRNIATQLYRSITKLTIQDLNDSKNTLHLIFPEIDINDFSEDAIKAVSGLMFELKQGIGDGIPGFIAPDEAYR